MRPATSQRQAAPAPVAPPLPTVPVVHAAGTRSCKVCKADVRVRVRAHRGRAGIAFAGYCERCGTHIGSVGRSKVREADQVRLELVADEFNPEQVGLFSGVPTNGAAARQGDGA